MPLHLTIWKINNFFLILYGEISVLIGPIPRLFVTDALWFYWYVQNVHVHCKKWIRMFLLIKFTYWLIKCTAKCERTETFYFTAFSISNFVDATLGFIGSKCCNIVVDIATCVIGAKWCLFTGLILQSISGLLVCDVRLCVCWEFELVFMPPELNLGHPVLARVPVKTTLVIIFVSHAKHSGT